MGAEFRDGEEAMNEKRLEPPRREVGEPSKGPIGRDVCAWSLVTRTGHPHPLASQKPLFPLAGKLMLDIQLERGSVSTGRQKRPVSLCSCLGCSEWLLD